MSNTSWHWETQIVSLSAVGDVVVLWETDVTSVLHHRRDWSMELFAVQSLEKSALSPKNEGAVFFHSVISAFCLKTLIFVVPIKKPHWLCKYLWGMANGCEVSLALNCCLTSRTRGRGHPHYVCCSSCCMKKKNGRNDPERALSLQMWQTCGFLSSRPFSCPSNHRQASAINHDVHVVFSIR